MGDSPKPLDENLYARLDAEDISFLKSQTGINDDEELRKHVLKVQADIYAVQNSSVGITCPNRRVNDRCTRISAFVSLSSQSKQRFILTIQVLRLLASQNRGPAFSRLQRAPEARQRASWGSVPRARMLRRQRRQESRRGRLSCFAGSCFRPAPRYVALSFVERTSHNTSYVSQSSGSKATTSSRALRTRSPCHSSLETCSIRSSSLRQPSLT